MAIRLEAENLKSCNALFPKPASVVLNRTLLGCIGHTSPRLYPVIYPVIVISARSQCGQFFGRTFWRGRKLTLNLTKRRAHTPSIKTAVMDLLTEQAGSTCRDADRSTHPPH